MERLKEWIEQHQILCGLIIVLFFLFIYFVSHFIDRPKKDAWLNVSFINEYNNVHEGSRLFKDTTEMKDAKDKLIVFDTNYFFDLSNDKDYANSYFQKLVAYIEAGTTDVIIGDESNINGISKGGRLLDLRDERVEEQLKEYSERFYYFTTEDKEIIPVAISLRGSRYEEELGYQDEVFAGIASTEDDAESAISFIKLLLD